MFHWCCCIFDNCKIVHWEYIICSFDSFHFFCFTEHIRVQTWCFVCSQLMHFKMIAKKREEMREEIFVNFSFLIREEKLFWGIFLFTWKKIKFLPTKMSKISDFLWKGMRFSSHFSLRKKSFFNFSFFMRKGKLFWDIFIFACEKKRDCLFIFLLNDRLDAFMCGFYFVFIASIRLVTFYITIAFYKIFVHFFDVIIFVTIKALNYFTFSWKYHCIFFTFFFQEVFVDYFINFSWKFCFYY